MRGMMRAYRKVGSQAAFRRFWLGMLISRTGDAFTVVALSWLVLEIAGPAQLGLVLLCFGLPRIVGGPLAGSLLDRYEPRRLLAIDNALRMSLTATLPLLIVIDQMQIEYLYVIAVASALLSSVTEVAEGALVPRLVDDEHLEAANSLLSVNWEFAYIAGPSLAGLLVAHAGAGYALLLDAVSFGAMALICLRLPPLHRRQETSVEAGAPRRNWLGVRILFRIPVVLILSLCSLGVLFLGGATEVLYPVYSRIFLEMDAAGYGLLVTATGVGALLGVVLGVPLFRRLTPSWRIGTVLLSGAPLFALLAVAPGPAFAYLVLGLASFLWGPYYVLERSLIQRLIPDAVRGQVTGARIALSSFGFPVGSAFGGLILATVSIPAAILAMAACYTALGLVAVVSRPIRRLTLDGAVDDLPAPTASAKELSDVSDS
jgi:predicted MFS family arabinose efflux permease